MDKITVKNEIFLKTAEKIRILRYILFVALILLIIASLALMREDITIENMRYLMKYVDVQAPDLSSSKKQIYYRGDKNSKYTLLRNDLAVLNNSNFELYSFSGRKLFSHELKYSNPSFEKSQKYMLCYNIGGTELSMFNTFSCVYSGSFANGVYGADILDNGAFAIITAAKNYTSGIEIYNKKFSNVFRWMSPDKFVISVDLAENEKESACLTVFAKGGQYCSEFLLFDINEGKEKFSFPITNEFPYKAVIKNDKYIAITDKAIHFINSAGEEENSIFYPENSLSSYYLTDDYIILACETSTIVNNFEMKIVDFNGNLLYNEKYDENILNVSLLDNYIYVLCQNELNIKSFEEKENLINILSDEKIAVGPDIINVFAAENNEYVLVSNTGAGKYSIKTEE